MAIAVVGAQVPRKSMYVEERASYKRYRITYDFEERTRENIKETLPVFSFGMWCSKLLF